MRRLLTGLAALVAVATPLLAAAPAGADGIPPIPAPCGGPMPCGGADEKAAELVNRITRMCPGNACPR